ncbi:DinB family protein [Deinococcus sp.]|uniref:DinB family protein n=1 Tax=Deinococcus sp. TaxID=47478 RepID=UPI003B5C8427
MTAQELLTLTPAPAQTPEIGVWLSVLREGRERTLRRAAQIADLDAVPERGHSAGTLLYHVALIEMDWLYSEVLEKQEADFPPEARDWFPLDARGEDGKLSAVTGESLERHLERLAWVRARLEETFEGMGLEEFRRVRQMEDYDVTPEWVLMHLALHESHHEGQLSLLPRAQS